MSKSSMSKFYMSNFIKVLLVSLLLSGCSNIKPYQSSSNKNLLVKSNTDEEVKAAIDIYHIDKSCKYAYKGTVSLNKGKNKIGLRPNTLNYLVVSFTTSSFWASSTSSMSQDMTIKPDKKHNYNLNLSYIDNIYNIELSRTHMKSRKTVALDINTANTCDNK